MADTPGFDEIWTHYRSALKAFLLARVANPAYADDLLQDILLASHRSLPALNSGNNLRTWLFTIARNTITDHYRRAARADRVHPDDLWYDEDDPEVRTDLERCVLPFIKALPTEQARLLHTIEIEGQSQKEVAKTMGIPYSTLKSRVGKARDNLRNLFDRCCHFELDRNGKPVDYSSRSSTCGNC